MEMMKALSHLINKVIHKNMLKKLLPILTGCLIALSSCNKDSVEPQSGTSIKLISTVNVPGKVRMVSSSGGNLLAYFTSETQGDAAFQQELFLVNPSGEVLKNIKVADTVFQYMNAIPAVNGGFMVVASDNSNSFYNLFHIGNNGDVIWSKNIPLLAGGIINEPLITSYNNQYLVIYQSFSWGYYMWKGDASGNEILHKKIPIPNAQHYGSGLNYGEKYSRFIQGNDSLIIIQGITYDEYDQMIENCFLRTVDENVNKKWYSTNYDSTHIESSSGLFYSADNKIVLFGTKSDETVLEGYGDVFSRTYSLTGVLENEIEYPRVGGTINVIRQTIKSPDGGYLMIGSNNQLPSNLVVSPTQLVLIKLSPDLSVSWSRTLNSGAPAKGFDATYLSDGSIGLVELLKENNTTNKIIYLHLDSNGNLINN
jgi:hypothetical protein